VGVTRHSPPSGSATTEAGASHEPKASSPISCLRACTAFDHTIAGGLAVIAIAEFVFIYPTPNVPPQCFTPPHLPEGVDRRRPATGNHGRAFPQDGDAGSVLVADRPY